MLEAFRENRQLHRDHMRELLTKDFKQNVILKYWEEEVRYNQRTLFDLAKELDLIEWYDEEVWQKIVDTAVTKTKINNIHDFELIHNLMHKLNTAKKGHPAAHLNSKFETQLMQLIELHYTVDRQWKYNAETRSLRPMQEMIAKRENARMEDHVLSKSDVDEETIIKARDAEKKLKRLKMAKYSHDLFDEIIEEMMREKKTILEMMAELDASE